MIKLFYLIAAILIVAWAIGFVGYTTGSIILILITVGIVAVLLRTTYAKRPVKRPFKKSFKKTI